MFIRRFETLKIVGIVCGLSTFALVGCGDDDGGGPDAAAPDATPAPDARLPDAMMTVNYAGSVGVHEVTLLDRPTLGSGLQITTSFNLATIPTTANFPGPGAGNFRCSATLSDKTMAAQIPPALNEGTVKVEVKAMGGGAGTAVPDCAFVGTAYRCLSLPPGTGGTVAATAGTGTTGVTAFTPSPAATFTTAMIGNYLIDTMTGGAFPVVGANATTLAVLGATPGAFGPWLLAAGVGPIPAVFDPTTGAPSGAAPDFLADTDTVKVSLTPGGGNHFTALTTTDLAVGDSFTLADDTVTLLNSDLDLSSTTGLTFGCKTGTAGCAASTGLNGTLILIDSTDATTFTGDTDLGTPARYSGNITCGALNTSVTIPAGALAVLKQGNPTRLRISVFRDSFEPLTGTNGNAINVVAGHGFVKFQKLND